MRLTTILTATLLGVLALIHTRGGDAAPTEDSKPMIAHNVFFTLNDDSPEAREKLVAECHKYLADIPGIEFYAAGRLAEQFDRPVNDRDFHVGLHVVFTNADTMQQYLVHPRHVEFVDRNKSAWAKVRVFDSEVEKK
jgi:hypothetical protein